METKAIIFTRVSSTTERQSTERQVNELTKYCITNNITIASVFEERISGAKKNEERIVLTDAVNYCITNGVKLFMVNELSRLGRNTLEVLKTIELLHSQSINVFIQNHNIYTLNEDGTVNVMSRMFLTILAECASMERTLTQERLNSGLRNYVDKGGVVGRKEGYTKPDDKVLEDNKDVIKLLKGGMSVINIRKITGKSNDTIYKIKKIVNGAM